MAQQAWTLAEIEEFEAIELPTREAFTGLGGGLININLGVCLKVDVDVNVSLGSGGGGSCGGGCS